MDLGHSITGRRLGESEVRLQQLENERKLRFLSRIESIVLDQRSEVLQPRDLRIRMPR